LRHRNDAHRQHIKISNPIPGGTIKQADEREMHQHGREGDLRGRVPALVRTVSQLLPRDHHSADDEHQRRGNP
jgi:hypothetical protein